MEHHRRDISHVILELALDGRHDHYIRRPSAEAPTATPPGQRRQGAQSLREGSAGWASSGYEEAPWFRRGTAGSEGTGPFTMKPVWWSAEGRPGHSVAAAGMVSSRLGRLQG